MTEAARFDPGTQVGGAAVGAADVCVWEADGRAGAETLAACEALLSERERERSRRLRVPEKRVQWIVAQALLRRVLGEALGEAPERVRLTRGAKGKPYLDAPWSRSGIQFNVTHTTGRVMVAATVGRELGIDCECLRDDVDAARIVRRHFTASEQRAFFSLPERERRRAFFLAWTRKEALLKALGAGLGGGLSSFAVTLAPGDAAAVREVAARFGAASDWALANLDAGPDHAAALAAAHDVPLRVRSMATDVSRR